MLIKLLKYSTFTSMACAGLLMVGTTVWAEDDAVNYGAKEPTVDELVEALTPKKIKTRGLKLGGQAAAVVIPAAVSIEINFEFDSYKLTPDGEGKIKKFGEALSREQLAEVKYRVEGHTDARGSDSYNMALSKRRAEAVRQYLVANYKIDSARLKAVGRGKTELLDPDDPFNGKNRRVMFRSVGEN